MRVIFKQSKIQGTTVGHLKAFEENTKVFDTYKIKPIIEKVYKFNEAAEAYQHPTKGAFGKNVIKVD